MLNSLWVSVRDYLFPKIPLLQLKIEEDGGVVCFGGGRKHWVLRSDSKAYKVRYQYSISHPHTCQGKNSIATPPLHYHFTQTETLVVRSGVLGYMLDGKEHKAGPGQAVVYKPYHRHSFWADPSGGEDLVFDLTAAPGEGLEGELLDNLDGYISSALAIGKTPKFLQMMVFIYDSDSAVALPGPLGGWLTTICGRWIGPFLGYKARYKEFLLDKNL